MKGIIIVSKFWTRFFSAGNASAITIFPFVFLRDKSLKEDEILINHERIHLSQVTELLIVPFYTWYLIEFIVRFLKYRQFRRAYLNISFEREAYRNENNLSYLKARKIWSFWRYL
ncbi:hypothetical protein [Sphingobacterium olei]|uniref:hypothetical protein n=1 Tax=Sphingobacterium olei TaxID=2571155 RepID=UPI001EE3DCF8|nr:hypothetical protein [Sphingobacterium olei]